MRRVLIITYHFPPVNNINARRFGEMAPYMPDFGWEPIILTTNSRGSLPVKTPEDSIIRIGKNYYDETKIIPPDQGNKGIPAILKLPYFFYRKLGIELRSIDRFILTWGKEVKKEKELIKKINPDLVIGSCYPPVGIWLGRFFSKFLKKPWIADFQDPLSFWNNSKFPFVKFLDEQIDKYLLKDASVIIHAGSYLIPKMERFYNRSVEVIYNGFDKIKVGDELEKENKKMKENNNLTVYYAGRFHLHRMPAIRLFINWLAENRAIPLLFMIRSLGPKEENEEIMKYAKDKNVFSKINLLPPTSPEIIFQEEKKANALILLEDLNKMMRNSEGTLTGKLFEYLPFRAPIITINRSDSEIGKILKETSRGYLVSNMEELKGAIEDILNQRCPTFDWEKVKVYSRFSQCQKLCEIFNKVYESQR